MSSTRSIMVLEEITRKMRRYSHSSKFEFIRRMSHFCDSANPMDEIIDDILIEVGINPTQDNKKRLRDSIYNYNLEYLAIVSIVDGEWGGALSDFNTYSQFKKVYDLLNNYSPYDKTKFKDQLDYSILFSRILLQQKDMQNEFYEKIDRYKEMYMFESTHINMKDIFSKEFIYPYEDYVKLVTYVYVASVATSSKFSMYPVTKLIHENLGFDKGKIATMYGILGQNRTSLTAKYSIIDTGPKEYRFFNVNPLRTYPIIFEDSSWYIPIPYMMFNAITEGFYYRIFEKYGLTFKQDFGKYVFEQYVIDLVSLNNKNGCIIPEFIYSNEKRSADITLSKESELILVELKSFTPTLTYRSGTFDESRDELIIKLTEVLLQCCKKEIDILEGKQTHDEFPKKITKTHFLVISFGNFYITTNDELRDQILLQDEFMNNPKYSAVLESKLFHFISVDELENFCKYDKRSLFDILNFREQSDKNWNDFFATQIESDLNRFGYYHDLTNEMFNITDSEINQG